MTKAFDVIMEGLGEVEAYAGGARKGYAVHIPEEVDVRAIRHRLKLSQPKFAATFGFSVGRIRDWEQKRFPVDAPSRVLLTVIEREPDAVLRALSRDGTRKNRPPAAEPKRARGARRTAGGFRPRRAGLQD